MIPAPTIAEVNSNIISQLEAALNETIPLLPKAFNRVLAKVLAGVFILLWKYGGFIGQQLFVSSATIKEVTILGKTFRPLVEWGRLIGVGDPIAAVAAELQITITVINQTGSLDSGTQFIASSNGVTYLLSGSVALSAPIVTGNIVAVGDQSGGAGLGVIGNLQDGASINFANPIANVARETIVSATTVTGSDEEDADVYRQRVIDRFQKRPQGGALIDYEVWGEAEPGILNIYPYTGATAGIVEVYVEATVASSGNPDGIPTGVQLATVADAIQLDDSGLASRRPAGSAVNVQAITRTGFDVTVAELVVANPSSVQAQIDAAVVQYLFDREPFVSGVTLPPRRDVITKSGLIAIIQDIVDAAGGSFLTIDFAQTGFGGNLFTYTLGEGEKAKLTGSVGF